MSKTTSTAIKIVISVLLVGGALTYLITTSFGESMIYYKTVDELFAERARFTGQPVRVNGLLLEGSVQQKPGTDEYRFTMVKNAERLEVSYTGILPDSMAPGRELVIEGVLQPEGRQFAASEILTKCPSKYEDVAKAKGGQ